MAHQSPKGQVVRKIHQRFQAGSSEQLFFLENAGVQLDARIDVLGCDLATVQNVALDRVGDLDASSYPAQELLRLLLGG